MPGFVSPLADLAGWTLSPVPQIEIPKGFRYGGIECRGLRAVRATAADVLMPAAGVLRQPAVPADPTVVEIQVNPFRMREVIGALRFGLPTFYLFFDGVPPFTFTNGDIDVEGAALASVSSVTFVQMGQDRIVRDPAEWAREIAAAMAEPDPGPTSWQAFSNAVAAALNGTARRPILILDHRGRPAEAAGLGLVLGPPGSETVQNIVLTPADAGDLQAALRRLGLPDDPLATGGPVRLRQRGGDVQFARIEDGIAAAGEIELTQTGRHIQLTDLERWFAPQFAVPVGETTSPLRRYTRGNRLTPFVNGRPFFRDFFDRLQQINGTGQGVHLTGGYTLDAEVELLDLLPNEPERPTTVKAALEAMKVHFNDLADGGGRFLSAKFIQIEPSQTLSDKEIAAFYFLVGIIGVANMGKLGLTPLTTDGSGFAILVLLALLHHNFVQDFIDENGKPFEFMRDAVELLDDPALSSINKFSANPATVDDNPLAPTGFPFDTLFPFIRHFGLYHQKIAIIRNGEGVFGYCGGVDMNPNRVDDADHNVAGPYHDMHALVEGEAAIDVATTFEQRWERDGRADDGAALPLAFSVVSLPRDNLEIADDVVQVARTYPEVLGDDRRLKFAPLGDRTICDTTLRAIAEAREYIHIEDQYFTPPPEYVRAIVQRVRSGDLRRLVIALPTKNDQPYGDQSQTQSIALFKEAEAEAGATPGEIVKIGGLRRHFTVASNTLRSASGKLIVGGEMVDQPASPGFDDTIVLGPKVRLPHPPFWISVDGELMWVFDEAPVVIHGEPPEGTRRFLVDRGQRTNLFGLGTGAKPRAHSEGAAATVVDLKGIFVHAKMILIDDVFAGIGSANVNRRGFYSDGEGHFFWMSERLKAKPPPGAPRMHNPIAQLRHEIWAELLNLPYPMAAPLLDDPVAAASLFDRLPIHGNRFVPLDAMPQDLAFGVFNGGDRIIETVLKAIVSSIVNVDHDAIFKGIVDPTTLLEPLP
jgi:phosphatidylserine/phosphatidylglycerophosphate/cardiolipin synthase-like enzyme